MTERSVGSGARATIAALAVLALLAGCASGPRSGRDGGPERPPSGLDNAADATPRVEPIRSSGGTSKPYTVLGRSYVPITDDRAVRETGLASWYGRKFHGQPTASGEPYDMYAMTAAHKTLPLPSYVRVRNPANGREAIVRVNDRGPFHEGRIIDLSYTAAHKLDLLRGVAPVEIERLTNEDIRTGAWRRGGDTQLAAAPAPAPAPALQPQQAMTPAAAPSQMPVPSAWTAPVSTAPAEPLPVPAPAAMQTPAPTQMPAALPLETTSSAVVATALPPLAQAQTQTQTAPQTAPQTQAGAETGFWVQIGAFRERGGADVLMAQAVRGLPALASQLRVFSEAGTHRLQAGPFASREAAGQAMAQVREGLLIAPVIVERR